MRSDKTEKIGLINKSTSLYQNDGGKICTHRCKESYNPNGSKCPVLNTTMSIYLGSNSQNGRNTICGSHRIDLVANSGIKTRYDFCGRDIVTIHTKPGLAHWDGVKRVISYLGSTKDSWLTFGGGVKVHLEEYSNADWATQPHRHSILGFSFHYGQGVISWSSKKQSIIALSSTEAEYVAETHAAKEALCLETFINEVTGIDMKPLTVMCNNLGTISLATDNEFHSCSKHIDLKYHFVCEAVEEGKITLKYVSSQENIADIFTKSLAKVKFAELVTKLGLRMLEK